ncbi:MAG: helix-turn-helix domain-containing protein [Armatimonadota bacterium]
MKLSQRHIELSAEKRAELIRTRDTAPKAYMRERCATILKVADGTPGYKVAMYGLLKARKADTVYRWIDRYNKNGIDGLKIKPGRGRKPAFSPCGGNKSAG